jgi:hypothetical protein
MANCEKPGWNGFAIEVINPMRIRDYGFFVEPYRQSRFFALRDETRHEHFEYSDSSLTTDMSDMHSPMGWLHKQPRGADRFSKAKEFTEGSNWPWIAHFYGEAPNIGVGFSPTGGSCSLDANASLAIEQAGEVRKFRAVHV